MIELKKSTNISAVYNYQNNIDFKIDLKYDFRLKTKNLYFETVYIF